MVAGWRSLWLPVFFLYTSIRCFFSFEIRITYVKLYRTTDKDFHTYSINVFTSGIIFVNTCRYVEYQ